MPTTGKRHIVGRGKGYLNEVGLQFRFILFLLIVLVFFSLLLLVFQKLSVFLPLFVFLPIALTTLLLFVGIAGTIYSHAFVGPMIRIRRALEQLAEGETNLNLRLRESDDPLLKELANSITTLADQVRDGHVLIREARDDLSGDIKAIQEAMARGAGLEELAKHIAALRKKQDQLDKAIIKTCGNI